MQPFGEFFILRAVADETGVILKRLDCSDERGDKGNKLLRYATAEKEVFGNLATRSVERIMVLTT